MNKPLVIGLSLVACGAMVVGALSLRRAVTTAASAAPAPPLPQQQAAPQPIESSTQAATPLKDWQRFPQMPSDEQERYATRVMAESSWSPEMRAGLLRQLANRSLAPVTRNNLAIGILRNGSGTTDLEQALWTAYDEVTEDPVWREYSIQFMAVCLEEGSTADGSRARVLDAFHGGGAMAATAAIQLNRLADKAVVPLPEDFATILVDRAKDPTLAPAQRSTLLGIIGMRRITAGGAVARGYLTDADVTMRRTAFACLGDLGGAEDLPAIELGLTDAHPLVQMAAAGAKEKIAKRVTIQNIPRPNKD